MYIPKLKCEITFQPLIVKAKYRNLSRFNSIGIIRRLEPNTVMIGLRDPNTIVVDKGQLSPLTLYKCEKNVIITFRMIPVEIIIILITAFYFINLRIV